MTGGTDEIEVSTDIAGRSEFVLLASIRVKRDAGIRFYNNSSSVKHNGEKIILSTDFGCGVNVLYRGRRYRITPEDISAGIIDAVDGTTSVS